MHDWFSHIFAERTHISAASIKIHFIANHWNYNKCVIYCSLCRLIYFQMDNLIKSGVNLLASRNPGDINPAASIDRMPIMVGNTDKINYLFIWQLFICNLNYRWSSMTSRLISDLLHRYGDFCCCCFALVERCESHKKCTTQAILDVSDTRHCANLSFQSIQQCETA